MITEQLLRQMMPAAGARLVPHLPYIGPAMDFGKITEPMDIACFVAQLSKESGEYRYMREIADGSDYEGRLDLGNIHPGDGVRYPGRGGIQVTGRAAARACGQFFGQPFEARPELMELPQWATHVSVWFWVRYKPGLQAASKRGWFRVTTRITNGGYTHLAERIAYHQRNRQVLGLPPYRPADEEQSIREFQRAHGLDVDGDVGPMTLKVLRAAA